MRKWPSPMSIYGGDKYLHAKSAHRMYIDLTNNHK